jgi:outer membrane lipoprotein carrier protein
VPLIAVATLWLCLAGNLAAEDPLARFEAALHGWKTLEARFTQEVESPLGRESASGIVWVQQPDRLKWEYLEPEHKIFFLRKNRYEFYLPADKQLVVQELEPAEIDETPLVFILGGRKKLDQAYASQLIEQRDGRSRYLLTARKAGSLFPRVLLTLAGDPPFPEELVLHEDSGAVHTYRFSSVKINPSLPDRLFEFKPPPGVEIIRQE